MQSFVSRGKNVKEAIQLGLESMEAKKKEVSIEIIALEKKGFIGIGRKKAVVKLTRSKEETLVKDKWMNLETMEKQLDQITGNDKDAGFSNPAGIVTVPYKEEPDEDWRGKAWVENGELFVKDSPDQYPLVTIGRGVQLLKNNQLVTEQQVIVSERDKVKINLIEEEQDSKWKITVDKHRLQAILKVIPGHKVTYKLDDIQPDKQIKLVAEENKEMINTIKQAEVMKELESLSIKNGVNYRELERALQTKEEGTFEIATGKKAKEGKDGWVELKVEVDTKNGLEMDATGKINYREIKTIPTVDSGKVIAIIHPPVPGESGSTITDEPLPPRQTHPIILKTGKGVTAVDN